MLTGTAKPMPLFDGSPSSVMLLVPIARLTPMTRPCKSSRPPELPGLMRHLSGWLRRQKGRPSAVTTSSVLPGPRRPDGHGSGEPKRVANCSNRLPDDGSGSPISSGNSASAALTLITARSDRSRCDYLTADLQAGEVNFEIFSALDNMIVCAICPSWSNTNPEPRRFRSRQYLDRNNPGLTR